MNSSLRVLRLFGIPIYIHYSWLIIFTLVTTSLALGYFPTLYRWQSYLYWVIGVATSLLFFASVVVHELTHSLVSRFYGIPVRSITLFVFGGVARISKEASQPGREFLMALSGPLSSLALAGIFGILYLAVFTVSQPVAALAWWLLRINVLLAAFNLIPGFPLDGGRVFRAILWRITRNFRRATLIAAGMGRIVGYLFMAAGVAIVLITGDWLGGIWFGFIGWFLENAAATSSQQTVLREALRGVRVGEMMSGECVSVAPQLTLKDLVETIILPRGSRCIMVVEHGKPRGMLTMANLQVIPKHLWASTAVERAMVPLSRLSVADPQEEATALLERMEETDAWQMVVLKGGEVVGMVSREQLLSFARTRAELGY